MVAARASAPAVRAPAIGVALSATRLVATWWAVNGSLETRELPVDATGADAWFGVREALREAISGWRASWGDASCTVRVALLAPLVEVRTVSLPPVSAHDAQRLLARAAARYFLSTSEPVTVGVSTPVTVNADAMTCVAAAAPIRLVRALRDAVTAAGGTLGDIMPALVTWSLGDAPRRAPHGVIDVGEALFELVTWRNGAPVGVRRFARPDDLPALCDACATLDGAVTLIAADSDHAAIASSLAQHGISLARAHADAHAPITSSIAARAAWRLATVPWHATADALPLALPDSERETPRRPSAAWSASQRRLWVASALLLLAAAGVYRVGVLRELQAVRAERAAIAPALDSLGVGARSNDPLALERAVREAARTTVPWARVLATLGVVMPRDAHVIGLRAMGDTIELEGAARNAGGVFAALEQARFTELSATAPVRRERSANGAITERFTFRARVPQPRVTTPNPRLAEGTP